MKQAKRIRSRIPHFDEVKFFATHPSTVASNVFTEIFKRAIGLPQFNVKLYGAKGDGTTDDSTTIQNAINAANTAGGGVVFFPAGTYQINTSLNLKTKVILMGSGYASKLQCTGSNDLITFAENANWWRITNLQLVATGGHIFAPAASVHVVACWIDHCWMVQNSTDKAVWYQTTGHLIELRVTDNDIYVAGATRTVPAWYVLDPCAACNSNWWVNNVFTYGDVCNNQPFFYLECQNNNDFSYDNHWVNNVFESCDGGSLQLLSTFGSVIEGCFSYDNVSLAAPVIYIGKGALGIGSALTIIRDSGRIGSGISAGVKDITLEPSCRTVSIHGFRRSPNTGQIDCGSATDVALLEISSGTTISNAGNAVIISGTQLGIGVVPTSPLQVNGAIATAVVSKTAAYTLSSTDSLVLGDATAGAFTLALPDATTCQGRRYMLKKTDSSANVVTVGTTNSQTIDGATTTALSTPYASIDVVSDGSNWQIV